ncbi:MAG: hypothetical protein BWY78_01484 [Alphaproteobacteria bacterium ADurb.Bin438]|nr:MAG: hypothetical protein BWY78_01484 [Alphaproteobacteria bacterium ADurb.Bin438]
MNDFSKKDKKDDGFFIPEQGSINNLPTPGVMTKEQKERAREGNVGFAINDGSYKVEKQSYEHDLFGKNSPKVASRFKSKKSGKDNGGGEEKEEKKGIFSVFKKK